MTLAHLTIATQDSAATAKFFQEIFDWGEVRRPANVDLTTYWLDIGKGQQVHVLQVDGFEASPFEKEFGRHFAFLFPAAKLATIRERLAARNVEVIPPIRPTPFERFFFQDPNGYMFEVIDQDKFVPEK
ncbi:Glyoxalase-like domain protein [Bremerella volcania]|uniref:Glyoxalase-like domain protein n=1 Tax=Bremerella volcania TaxID=2527984 RepID=A0A518C2X3_9BACT|nr:VOC family protein [Bremerella volcania]QDU73570.1 Glyoxalase-like domain protein [Bremerella volcania]